MSFNHLTLVRSNQSGPSLKFPSNAEAYPWGINSFAQIAHTTLPIIQSSSPVSVAICHAPSQLIPLFSPSPTDFDSWNWGEPCDDINRPLIPLTLFLIWIAILLFLFLFR